MAATETATKIAIALPPKALAILKDNASREGITMTEWIRRAISLYSLATEDEGVEVILRNKQTDRETLVRIV